MQTVALEILAEIAALSVSSPTPEVYEAAAINLVGDITVGRRAIEWLPEAFGMVLASHVEPTIEAPHTFLLATILANGRNSS
jgi:hypothetical protein